MGPFKVVVSREAERLDYGSLSRVERELLCGGVRYDADVHDIFRFFCDDRVLERWSSEEEE